MFESSWRGKARPAFRVASAFLGVTSLVAGTLLVADMVGTTVELRKLAFAIGVLGYGVLFLVVAARGRRIS